MKVPLEVTVWNKTALGKYNRAEQRDRGGFQHKYLASMWTKIFWKRPCCCSGATVWRTMRIIMDTALMIRIGTALLTGVGGVIAIAEFGGGGLCWRRRGATIDVSLEAQWLAGD